MTGIREHPNLAAPETGEEPPRPRVLRFLGPDAAAGVTEAVPYVIGPAQLLRLVTRQLFAYPAAADRATPGASWRPVPDAAQALPTVANGGVSEDGRTYRIRLRDRVRWDAQAAREVTAGDFVRGIKRTAHPRAAAIRPYLAAVIEGMGEYYAAYDAAFAGWVPDAPALAQFQRANQVVGLTAESDKVLVVRLCEPANDLVDLLATGFAAAAPREYDYHVPDSPELYRTVPSAGPYRVARSLTMDGDLVLEPNPRWDPSADPVRRRTAERIHVSIRPRAPDQVRHLVVATGLDPAWSFGVVSWSVPPLDGATPQGGFGQSPYLLFDPATSEAVRRAVACAVDRAAVAAAVRALGALVSTPHHRVLPPGTPGAADALPDPDALPPPDVPYGGDPARARELLARGGYGGGLRLALAVPPGVRYPGVVAALTTGLARAGIALAPVPPGDRADLELCDWAPMWPGNNGRDLVRRLWGSAGPQPDVADLAAAALRDSDERRAADLWRRLDTRASHDLRVVPLVAAVWPRALADCVATGLAHW